MKMAILVLKYIGTVLTALSVLAGVITVLVIAGWLVYNKTLIVLVLGLVLLAFYLYARNKVKTNKINIDEIGENDIATFQAFCAVVIMCIGIVGICYAMEHGKDVFML